VSASVVKWSEGLRNRVSIIIRRYTDRMKFYCFFHILLVLLYIIVYTECNRRNGPDFGRVILRSNYTDITQNTYIQS